MGVRYFARGGPDVALAETPERVRLVTRGERVAYDEFYPDEAAWAAQLDADPLWYETDSEGRPLAAGDAPRARRGAVKNPRGPETPTEPESAPSGAEEAV